MEFTMKEYAMLIMSVSDRIRYLDSLPASVAPNAKEAVNSYRELLRKIEENRP